MYRFILLLIVALTLGACGTDNNPSAPSKETTDDTTAREASTPEPTPTPVPDSDDDGTPDDEDAAPRNAKVQTEADAKGCDALGINSKRLKEGNCLSELKDGRTIKVKVVNRDTTLTLKQMNVTLDGIEQTDTIARPYDSPLVGSFVVAHVAVTNKLSAPVEIDASDMFSLLLGDKEYTPNFDAMNEGDEDGLIYEELQPDETATGSVVFKVRNRGALETNGNLFVTQFSDAGEYGKPKQRVGVIRTYH